MSPAISLVGLSLDDAVRRPATQLALAESHAEGVTQNNHGARQSLHDTIGVPSRSFPSLDQLRAAAFALSLDDQVALAQQLRDNVEPPDPEWEAELLVEIERRTAELEDEEVEGIPAEEVFAEIKVRLSSHQLHVLIYEEDGVVYAHAVEFGLAATDDSVGAALVALEGAVLEHYAAAERRDARSPLSLEPRPDIVRRHARARSRMLRRLAPDGDRVTTLAIPSSKQIAACATSLDEHGVSAAALDAGPRSDVSGLSRLR